MCHTRRVDRSGVSLEFRKLPEGSCCAVLPFDCLSLYIPSPSQYVLQPTPQQIGGRHVAQGVVVTFVLVEADSLLPALVPTQLGLVVCSN